MTEQETKAAAEPPLDCRVSCAFEAGDIVRVEKETYHVKTTRDAVQVDQKPVAWMTYDLGGNPMFWTFESEAALYCDDGEHPIPLYMAANA